MVINLDPVIFTLGPLQVRWYGLMYVAGFLIGTYLLKRFTKQGLFRLETIKVDALITFMIIGIFLGARIFYVFVYNWAYYAQNLTEIPAVWKGGLSFHGGLLGIVIAMWIFGRKNKLHFLQLSDWAVIAGCPGIFLVRMGNFINGELWGRVTDIPLGMIFPSGGPYPRHPSQLYEGLGEGLLLFILLWFLHRRVKINGILTGIFLMGYSLARFVIEFFREPDEQLGFFFGGTTTMGQILCFLTFAAGVGVLLYVRKKKIAI
ncbi:MAG: prolipoprotein diacylglyceryl transferase [Pseudomonadota bacterium]